MPVIAKPIVVVGSINTDLVACAHHIPARGETILGSDFQIHSGGKGANQAVAVARLGYPVQMIGQLGDDIFGRRLREHLSAAGVDVSSVGTVAGSSGVALITVAEAGENSIVVVPCANAFVSPAYVDEHIERIRDAGAVLAQLEIPIETVVRLAEVCADADVPFILDPAPARELPASTLTQVSWLTPNETEAAFFAPSKLDGTDPAAMAGFFLEKSVRGVVLKMGSRGAYVATGSAAERIPSYPATVVDTTAAGDAFNAAFATGLLLGKTPFESARFASAAAAISVTRKGAQPSMPSRREVERLLQATLAPTHGIG